jgi:hypothetical protein
MRDTSSESDIGHELDKLGAMTVGQLQEQYALVFGEHTNAGHKAWLLKRIAWRLQAQARRRTVAARQATRRGVGS